MEEKATVCGVVEALVEGEEETKKNGTQDTHRSSDALLWEQERVIRQQVLESRISGNLLGCFFANTYAAMHIFVVYLISLESLLSIALSVIMTVCKWTTTRNMNPTNDNNRKHTLTPFRLLALNKFS